MPNNEIKEVETFSSPKEKIFDEQKKFYKFRQHFKVW